MNKQQSQNIQPQAITKPIQLLAAWLFGLIAITGSFLSAAAIIEGPVWLTASLVISAILFVPLFLFAMFVLQTKFRPEMQEDNYYSEWLKNKHGSDSELQMHDYVNEIQTELVDSLTSLKTHGTLSFSSEYDFYEKVNFFIRQAEKKIEAIDFIPPLLWKTDFILRRYIDIQSINVEQLKKRIHIFNEDALAEFRDDYKSYIELMHKAGFDVGFLGQQEAKGLGIPILGGVNIDDNCVIINKNPYNGAETGVVSFLQEDINEFDERFSQISAEAVSVEAFKNKLNIA